MNTYGTTADGSVIDDALVERLARNAEEGFPGVTLVRPRTGRPPLGGDSGPAATRTVRLPPSLDAAVRARAEAERTTVSAVLRRALEEYLTTPA